MARGRRGVRRAVAGVAVLTVLAAGCDGGGSTPADPAPSGSTSASDAATPGSGSGASGEPVRLTFAVYGNDTEVAAYRRIAEEFSARTPRVHVDVQRFSDATTAARAVGAGAAGTPDVVLLDQLQLPRLVAMNALAPLDEALDERGIAFGDDFQRSALTTFSADAQLQCMPVEMSPLVVYWNRQLVPRAALEAQELDSPRGVDTWSWEAFEAVARAVAARDLLGPVKGTYIPPRLDLLTALLRSGGADVVDDERDPTTLTLASDDALGPLSAVVRLASDPAVSLTPDDLAVRDAVSWFAAGDLGLLIGTRQDLPRLQAAARRRGLDFGVVQLPSFGQPTSVSQATGICVAADSDAIDAATDFVAWTVSPRSAKIVAATGQAVPSRLATLTSRAFTEPGVPPRRTQAYLAAAKRSEPLPYSPEWPQVEADADDALTTLLSPASAGLGPRALGLRLARLDAESRQLLGTQPTS